MNHSTSFLKWTSCSTVYILHSRSSFVSWFICIRNWTGGEKKMLISLELRFFSPNALVIGSKCRRWSSIAMLGWCWCWSTYTRFPFYSSFRKFWFNFECTLFIVFVRRTLESNLNKVNKHWNEWRLRTHSSSNATTSDSVRHRVNDSCLNEKLEKISMEEIAEKGCEFFTWTWDALSRVCNRSVVQFRHFKSIGWPVSNNRFVEAVFN